MSQMTPVEPLPPPEAVDPTYTPAEAAPQPSEIPRLPPSSPLTPAERRRRRLVPLLALIVGLAGIVTLAWAVSRPGSPPPAPIPLPREGCLVATPAGSVSLTHEQMGIASIVAGVAVREDMGSRGATIGLATAMQESSLRNLEGGDRDSIGVFQQRPSQGWGTPEQLRDPYYATLAFYDELVKFEWRTGDVNDIAQKVQRSGVPDGYRKHVDNATILATALTGEGGTMTCVDRSTTPGNATALLGFARSTYGVSGVAAEKTVTFTMKTPAGAERMAYLALAHAQETGVVDVTIGEEHHTIGRDTVTGWEKATTPIGATTVVVTLR